jgi:2-polyprenyl-3-methyl-5-hydroxy-6-metoxy-1,4-benzoquinol methylase
VVAIDAVFASALRAKGIQAVEGPLDEALERLGQERFDTIVIADVLHLVVDSVEWLRALRHRLTASGQLVARVANTGELSCWAKDLWHGRPRLRFPRYESTGVHPVNARRLRRWCREARLDPVEITPLVDDTRRVKFGPLVSGPFETLLATSFLLKARRAT